MAEGNYFEREERLANAISPLEDLVNALPYQRRDAAHLHLKAIRQLVHKGHDSFGETMSKLLIVALATTCLAIVPGLVTIGLVAYVTGLSADTGSTVIAFAIPTWIVAVCVGFWIGRGSPS